MYDWANAAYITAGSLIFAIYFSETIFPEEGFSAFGISVDAEAFFGIPGLGSYTIDAIQTQDFAIVRAMVFLGSALYILGLLLTDISYTLVDPRVRLS